MSTQALAQDLETVLENPDIPVALDFYADWCMPCRMQAPMFRQAEEELQGKAEFRKVDIDKHPELAARFLVMSIPTIVVARGGTERWRSVGVTGKDEIVAAVKQAM